MKLIRLVSSDSGGLAIFDNHFNSIINIKPKSKIALDTCVLDITQKAIKIKRTINDEVRYQVSTIGGEQGDTRPLSIQNYNQSNIDSFLEDIENKLNANLIYNTTGNDFQEKAIGLEWFVERSSASNHGKLVIGYNVVPFRDYLNGTETNDFTSINDFWFCGSTRETFLEKTAIVGQGVPYLSVSKKAGALQLAAYAIKTTTNWCKGGGNFRIGRMLINNNSLAKETNGFMISIEDNEGQFVYGLRVNRTGESYETTTNGINFIDLVDDNDPGTPVLCDNAGGMASTISDCVEFQIDNQDIVIFIYRDGKPPAKFDTGENIQYGLDYKAVITITGEKAFCAVGFINYSISLKGIIDDRASYDSNDNAPNSIDYLNAHPRLTNTTPPHPVFRATLNNFYLPADIMKFLGFGLLRYPGSGNDSIDYARYVANQPLELGALSDNFIVQLNNIQLKSYDGDTLQDNGQRRSILSLIPDDDSDNQTLYNANERLFLDIDNLQDLNLNRISVSILDDNYEVVRLNNKSSLSVIIKDENE